MKIHRVIIHELNKPIGKVGAKLSKSLSLMDATSEDVIQLITELNKRYRKRDEKQGIFDDANPTIFHEVFRSFEKKKNDKNFIEFSIKSAENLRDRIEGIGAAKGGYLVYAQFDEYRNYCSVFFVRDITGIAFKRNKTVNGFDLSKVKHIDFEKLAMACRINMSTFGDDQSKYLSFIHIKSDDLSQYFVNWISSKDTVTSEEDTTKLLRALRKIPIPEAKAGEASMEREAMIRNAHSHIKASPTRTVNVIDMSITLFDDEDYLTDYLFENYPEIPTEFKAHSTTLQRFVRVYAKADQVELNFHPDAYKNGVIVLDQVDPGKFGSR
jgi:nucleoid-associated protein